MARSKFELYEKAVQSPDTHAEWFDQIYRQVRGGKSAHRLREDFCGTFSISAHWVKLNAKNSAEVLDLDGETLEYGRKLQARRLTSAQFRRIEPRLRNVISVSKTKADLLIACNFSFYIFKERKLLVDYFRAARASLARDGLMILEMAGGPGMIEPIRERKMIKRGGKWDYTYIWEQKSFDPIQHDAQYAIHFRLADGTRIENAFTYDWRLWTLPEVRDALSDAGFEDVRVFWETEHEDEGTGEYVEARSADNAWAWIAYVVAGARAAAPYKASRKETKLG